MQMCFCSVRPFVRSFYGESKLKRVYGSMTNCTVILSFTHYNRRFLVPQNIIIITVRVRQERIYINKYSPPNIFLGNREVRMSSVRVPTRKLIFLIVVLTSWNIYLYSSQRPSA